jgi:hypothetical protein
MHKTAPSTYTNVRERVLLALGYPSERRPLLIAVDGRDGAGKSSFASWLAWQTGAPAIYLDLLLAGEGLKWRTDDLKRLLATRLAQGGPLIVEGVLVLDAIAAAGRKADRVIFVENEASPTSDLLMPQIEDYWRRHGLPAAAHDNIVWCEPPGETVTSALLSFKRRLRSVAIIR